MDLTSGEVLGGAHGSLTDVERRLLAYLVDHAGEVVTRPQLRVEVWGAHPDVRSRMVDRAVARLRRKLMDDRPCRHLCSVYGQGYRLVLPSSPEPPGAPLHAPDTWALGSPRGPLVGRASLLEALHRQTLVQGEVSLSGPPGVGRWRLLQEVAWRQRDHWSGGVWPVDARTPLAPQLAALEPVRSGGADAWPTRLADRGPAVLVVRHADRLSPAQRQELAVARGEVRIWWVGPPGLEVPPLEPGDAAALLCQLRRSALPHRPWSRSDADVAQLVDAASGLPAVLEQAEVLSRSLPTDDVVALLASSSPIEALVRASWGACTSAARELACTLAWFEHPVDPADLGPVDPEAVRSLATARLLPDGTPWALLAPVRSALRSLDPDPVARWTAHLASAVARVRAAEAEVHRGAGLHGLAGASRELMATLASSGALAPRASARAVPVLEPAAEHLGVAQGVLELMDRFPPEAPGERAAQGRLWVTVGRLAEAEPLLAADDGPSSAAALARILAMTGRAGEARDVLASGAEAPGEPWHHHTLQRTWARISAFAGRWDAAMDRLHDDLQRCQRDGDVLSAALTSALIGHIQAGSGAFEAGIPNLRVAAERLESLGERRHHRLTVLALAQCLHHSGALAEADTSLATALASARADRHPNHERIAASQLVVLRLEQGRLAEAESHLATLRIEDGHAFQRVEHYLWAWLHALRGQCDPAAHSLAAGLSIRSDLPLIPARILAALLLHLAEHPGGARVLAAAEADLSRGDEEHAGGVAVARAVLRGERPVPRGRWGRISARWVREARRQGWRPTAWGLRRLVDGVVEASPPEASPPEASGGDLS